MKIENRKTRHDYFIEDKIECGISLRGHEIKSIRSGKCSINEAYCEIKPSGFWVVNMFVAKFEAANVFDVSERRPRQLLLHGSEIRRLEQRVSEKGMTLIPLSLYFVDGRLKVELGVCRGKHDYDKRQTLKDRQIKRDIEREAVKR